MCSMEKLGLIELRHRRLSHINYKDLVHLVNNERIKDIPKLSGELKPICGNCMKGKQTKSSRKKVKEIRTTRPLDLLYMDLMGLIRTKRRGGKRYVLVVVDDFSRFSFVHFLREKLETIKHLKSLFTRIQVEIGYLIVRVKNDEGRD